MKYIGIDIGDGESAVTEVSPEGALIPSVLPIGEKDSIRSIVGKLNGSPVIGDTVVLNHMVTNRSARFKSRFLYDEAAREDLRLFAQGLYNHLSAVLHDDKLKIALGCPAAWKEEARSRYANIVSSAGFTNVYTVSESRAAFLYAHYCNEFNLSPDMLKRPTLVIDIGSSTIDYAYIVEGKERDVGVFGEEQLGAGLLDALLLEKAVNESPHKEDILAIFEKYPSWKSYGELIARNVKEDYFRSEASWVNTPCSGLAPIYLDVHTVLPLKISVTCAEMEKLLDQPIKELKDRSFRQAVADTLERARSMTSEHPPELLIVTGGASRMAFFQDACKNTFPDALPALCNEPEFSIARGLGIAARTDDILSQFRAKVNDYFESGAVSMEVGMHIPHLLPEYVPKVAALLEKKGVLEAVVDFQGSLWDSEQFDAYIMDKIGAVLQDKSLMRETDEIINTWMAKRLQQTQAKLNELCDLYQIGRADMTLVKIRGEVKIGHVKAPISLRVLTLVNRNPVLSKLSKLIRNAAKIIPHGNSIMTRQLRRELFASLSEPNGEFAHALSEQLVRELQMQINEQIKKVEIQIN